MCFLIATSAKAAAAESSLRPSLALPLAEMASFVYLTAEYGRDRWLHRVHLVLLDGEAKVQFATLHHDVGQWHVSSWHGGWEAWGWSWVRVRAHWNGDEERVKVIWFPTADLVLRVWHPPCIDDLPTWILLIIQ